MTEQALGEFLAAQGVVARGAPRAEWYADRWFYAQVRGVSVPIFPRLGFRRGLPAHDAHHMLNGYATSWVGECETAAWELARGGCARHAAYWIDRVFFLALALPTAPRAAWCAFRDGLGKRNLYRLDPETLLGMELDDVRRYVDRHEARA